MMTQKHNFRSHSLRTDWGTTGRFLFADSSFIMGMARVFDLSGLFDDYNYSGTPEEADARAIWSDWVTVGNWLWEACDRVAAQHPDLRAAEPPQSGRRIAQTQLALR